MPDVFSRIWENLVDRTEGPMSLRFLIQPTMSLFFAIRAGLRDAKTNTAPYLWRLVSSRGERRNIFMEAWKDVGKVFIIGTILDIIYQLIVIFSAKVKDRFYPLESLLVAFLLALVPYLIFRGLAGRLIKKIMPRKDSAGDKPKG